MSIIEQNSARILV